eukprot:PhM_4_TR18648/c0_g1_i2/m.23143
MSATQINVGSEEVALSLCYHDKIILSKRALGYEAFLCPTGIASDELSLRRHPEELENSSKFTWMVFEILPFEDFSQHQRRGGANPSASLSAGAAATGTTVPDNTFQTPGSSAKPVPRVIKEVAYGDTVKLRHVDTDTYLSYSRRVPSRREVGNVQISLDALERGPQEKFAWFRVTPKFKVRLEGQKVQNYDEIALESYEGKMWVHVSDCFDFDHDAEYSEVNLSTSALTSSALVVSLYDPTGASRQVPNDPVNKRRLVASEALMLYHKDERGYFTANMPFSHQSQLPGGTAQLSSRAAAPPFCLSRTDGEMENATFTNGIFTLERGDKNCIGGILSWDRAVRIKHLATQKYLSVRKLSPSELDDNDRAMAHTVSGLSKRYTLELTSNVNELGAVFTLVCTAPEPGEYTVRLSNMYWLRSSAYRNAWIATGSSGTNVVLGIREERRYKDSFEFRDVPLLRDAMFVLNAASACWQYLHVWDSSSFPPDYVMDGMRHTLTRLVTAMVKEINTDAEILSKSGTVIVHLQRMLIEQDLHEMLLAAVGAPLRAHIPMIALEGRAVDASGAMTSLSAAAAKVREVDLMIFRVLMWVVRDNANYSQLLTRHVPFISQFLRFGIGAARCLMDVVTDNEQLALELEPQYITFFVEDMVKSKGRDPKSIKFLHHLLQCNGKPIGRTQHIIMHSLLVEHPYLLLQTRRQGDIIEVLMPPNDHAKSMVAIPDPNRPPPGWYWLTLRDLCSQEHHKELRKFHEVSIDVLAALCAGPNEKAAELCKRWSDELIAAKVFYKDREYTLEMCAAYAHLLRVQSIEVMPTRHTRIRQLGHNVRPAVAPPSHIATITSSATEYLSKKHVIAHTASGLNSLLLRVLELVRAVMERGGMSPQEEEALAHILVQMLDFDEDCLHLEANPKTVVTSTSSNNPLKNAKLASAIPVTSGLRTYREETRVAFSVKVMCCEILHLVLNRRNNSTVDAILSALPLSRDASEDEPDYRFDAAQIAKKYERELAPYLTPSIPAYNRNMTSQRLLDILVDCMQCTYKPLVDGAAALLFDVYHRPTCVGNLLESSILIRTADELELYATLKEHSNQLCTMLTMPISTAAQATALTNALKAVVTLIQNSKVPLQVSQELVDTLGLHLSLETQIRMSIQKTEATNGLLQAMADFIGIFSRNNPSNQLISVKVFVPFLLKNADSIQVAQTFIDIFVGNRDIIATIPDTILLWFLNKAASSKKPVYIDFLCEMSSLDGFIFERNLAIIATAVQHRRVDRVQLLVLVPDYHPAGLENLRAALFAKNEYYAAKDGITRYHIAVLRLLGCLVEARVLTILSLTSALRVFVDRAMPMYFRVAYLRYLNIILDNDERYSELFRDPNLHAFFKTLLDDVTYLHASKHNDPEFVDFFFDAYLPFMGMLMNKKKLPNISNAVLEDLLKKIIDYLSERVARLDARRESAEKSASGSEDYVRLSGADVKRRTKNFLLAVLIAAPLLMLPRNSVAKVQNMLDRVFHDVENAPGPDADAGWTDFVTAAPSHVTVPGVVLSYLAAWRSVAWSEITKLASDCKTQKRSLALAFVNGFLNDVLATKLMHLLGKCIPEVPSGGEGDEELSEREAKRYEMQQLGQQNQFNQLGVTEKMLFYFEHIDPNVYQAAMFLGIRLLTGGNENVQTVIYHVFLGSVSETFFVRVRQRLQAVQAILRSARRIQADLEEHQYLRDRLTEAQDLMRFLQLLCEGHNTELQEYIRDQPDNLICVNLVREVSTFLRYLFKTLESAVLDLVFQGIETLKEACQGPCPQNQLVLVEFGIGSIFTEILNLSENRAQSDVSEQELSRLLSAAIQLMLSVTEGIQKNSTIPEKLRDNDVIEKLLNKMNEGWIMGEIQRVQQDDASSGVLGFLDNSADDGDGEDTDFLDLGLNIYMYLESLARFDKTGHSRAELRRQMSYSYFHDRVGQIEIARARKAERVYFPIPERFHFIPEETKAEVHVDVKRDTPAAKVQDFFARWDDVIAEAEIFYEAQRNRFMRVFATAKNRLADVSLTLSIIMSGYLLFAMNHKHGSSTEYMGDTEFFVFRVMGVFQLLMELWLFFGWMRLQGRVAVSRYITQKVAYVVREKQHRSASKYQTLLMRYRLEMAFNEGEITGFMRIPAMGFILIQQKEFWISVLFAAAAPLGLFLHPIFFSVQVFRVIQRSDSLQNVIKAVTLKWVDLVATSLLGAVVVFAFSMIAFYFMDDKYYDYERNPGFGWGFLCQELSTCFFVNVVYGLRQGGGIGEALQHPEWNGSANILALRLIFDFVFWLIMIVIFLNIIFGIILDTFADLRDKKQDREKDKRTVCFICGIEAFEFDKYSGGFYNHYHEDHNMWKYLAFRQHINAKDATDLNGQESYVDDMCDRKDMSFFPIGMAICLEGIADDDDDDEEEREKAMMILVDKLVDTVDEHNRRHRSQGSHLLGTNNSGGGGAGGGGGEVPPPPTQVPLRAGALATLPGIQRADSPPTLSMSSAGSVRDHHQDHIALVHGLLDDDEDDDNDFHGWRLKQDQAMIQLMQLCSDTKSKVTVVEGRLAELETTMDGGDTTLPENRHGSSQPTTVDDGQHSGPATGRQILH